MMNSGNRSTSRHCPSYYIPPLFISCIPHQISRRRQCCSKQQAACKHIEMMMVDKVQHCTLPALRKHTGNTHPKMFVTMNKHNLALFTEKPLACTGVGLQHGSAASQRNAHACYSYCTSEARHTNLCVARIVSPERRCTFKRTQPTTQAHGKTAANKNMLLLHDHERAHMFCGLQSICPGKHAFRGFSARACPSSAFVQ